MKSSVEMVASAVPEHPSAAAVPVRVLLVEDDPEVIQFLRKLLLYLGYEVSHATDGLDAIKMLHHELPDVILTDILMPNMDGLRFCRFLRHNPRTGLIPVIMVSARGELQERLEGFRAGADDYIVKPFDVLELKARLESILFRSQREIWCNPISHLPGSPGIEAEVNHRLEKKRPFTFAYIDIDNFKAYNDVYGYHAGDQVIKDLAGLLMEFSASGALAESFCGHIGGDDFVFISSPTHMTSILPQLLRRFDMTVLNYYSPADQERGGITASDRQGQEQFFPCMRLSVGVVNTSTRHITHYVQLSEIASELKHHLKLLEHNGHSRCLWDGRTEPPPGVMA